jgi:glucose-1-phosphate cytidylyltransferase
MSTVLTPRVVILCGGLGMRLREETEHKPKPMVEIGGRPILWHIMRHYEKHGFTRFVLCLGYKGERIREYFLNYQYMHSDFTISLPSGERRIESGDGASRVNWEVTLVDTGQSAMTGARVKRVERYVDSDYFLCTYGDGVSNVDIRALVDFHRSHGKLATITGVSPPSKFGSLTTEGERVVHFEEKPHLLESIISGGFFVFDRRFLEYLRDDDGCILEYEPFARLAREGQMMAYRHKGYWQCMDTPRDVQQLNDEWRSGKPGWLK